MPELRWTLLIIGVVFVAALAWWERRRPHQASRDSSEMRPGVSDPSWGPDSERMSPRSMREPTLTLPEIRAREPMAPRELPIVEIPDDDSLTNLRVDPDRVRDGVNEVAKDVADDLPGASPEDHATDFAEDEAIAAEPVAEVAETAGAIVSIAAHPAAPEPAPERPPPVTTKVEPIVEWPAEDRRRLLALRLVASHPERLPGRALRQALAAEGFMLGKYGIFHKPDADNRAVLSAASLTKPGTFDLETMDTQRFVGLNLFAVLPGPKPPLKAFEELLLTARTLNERLEGALQDERGGPLTPMRIAALREALEVEAKS